jgi:hypothetical protein
MPEATAAQMKMKVMNSPLSRPRNSGASMKRLRKLSTWHSCTAPSSRMPAATSPASEWKCIDTAPSTKDSSATAMATPVAGRVRPRSASRPATGASKAPAAPASANSAMPRWPMPNSCTSASGTAVQKAWKAENIIPW